MSAVKHLLLFYETAPDYLERRAEHRSAHLRLAWDAVERGELVLGGALACARMDHGGRRHGRDAGTVTSARDR